MPCFRQASMALLRSYCWRTVPRLIERPSVFMGSVLRRRKGHRGEIRHRAATKAGRIERAERDGAVADRDAHATTCCAMIDIRMRCEEGVFFGARRAGHAVDVVVAVALEMRHTD